MRRRHKRKRVTAVHKANIMKLSDGLFLDCARSVARDYPEIQYDERIVDAACMHLVMHPETLDVLLLPNLYGDIVSDLCAGLVGGLGVVPAANLGEDGVGVFEAVHGTAPDIAGQDKANPTALLLSAVLMLHHLDEDEKAERVMKALWTRIGGRFGAHRRSRRARQRRRSSRTPSCGTCESALSDAALQPPTTKRGCSASLMALSFCPAPRGETSSKAIGQLAPLAATWP